MGDESLGSFLKGSLSSKMLILKGEEKALGRSVCFMPRRWPPSCQHRNLTAVHAMACPWAEEELPLLQQVWFDFELVVEKGALMS